ncbi:DUF2474 domain-containing protein [Methylobacillus sp.]|uniref:DUF2474 domain-containing protein n=1 Tax=Methylobacillus sp. TaxID=56818 RepID=UPI003FA56CF2
MYSEARYVTAMATTKPEKPETPRGLWLKRIGWLCLIWAVSVLAMLLAAYFMRLLMRMIGLHS